MTTESGSTTSSTSSTNSSSTSGGMGVPAAIVIAGGLIALAIYFGGGTSSGTPARPTTAGNNQPAVANNAGNNAPAPAGEIRAVSADDHIRGAANPKVTIVEYSDIECPFCKRFHPTVQRIVDEYPNDVAWVYRHFPLESIHPNARIAAIAAECAGDQGLFWETLDYMFDNTSAGADLAESNLPALARAAGVPDMTAFQSCLDNRQYDDRVSTDLADAQAAGGRGTPYSIIIAPDGSQTPLSGAQPYESVKAAVDQALSQG